MIQVEAKAVHPRESRHWGALLKSGVEVLTDAGVDQPKRAARWLLAGTLGVDAAHLWAYPESAATAAQVQAFKEGLRRCQQHEPLAYVLGYAEFRGLRLNVTPDVLIPRPETELLVDHALACISGIPIPRILDLGTGSGCIALAIKHGRPDAHVVGWDISSGALNVARTNAKVLGLNIALDCQDMLTGAITGAYDLIVSNPPYIPDSETDSLPVSVRDYEPEEALACGDDPLRFYRAILGYRSSLRSGGSVALEVHADYAEQVYRLFKNQGFGEVLLQMDYFQRPRYVVATLPSKVDF